MGIPCVLKVMGILWVWNVLGILWRVERDGDPVGVARAGETAIPLQLRNSKLRKPHFQ